VTATKAAPPGENASSSGADSITRNTAFGLATQLTTAAFTAALTLYLVRALGPDGYGVFALAVGFGTLLVLISDFGLSASSGRFIAEQRHEPRDVAGVTWDAARLKALAALPVCIALIVLADPVAGLYDNPDLAWPLRAMALVVVGQGMFMFLRNVFVAVGRASYTWQVTLLESVFEFVASVALVAAGAGATGAAFGRAAGYLIGALIAAVLVMRFLGRRAMADRTGGHARGMTRYAGALFVVTVAFTLFEQVDILLIGAIISTTAAGIFEAPLRLTTFLSYGGMAVAIGVAPRLARGAEGPNVDAYLRSMRYLTILQAALVAPLLAWSGPIVDLTLGSGYEQSADVLRALTPYVFLAGIGTFVTLAVNYIGEARRRVPLAIVTVMINVVLDLILLPRIGVVGGAIGTDVAFGIYALGHIWLCQRAMDAPVRPILASFARCLFAAGLATLALAAFGTDSLAAWEWVVGGIAGIAAYVAGLFITRETTLGEVAGLWEAVRSRIPALSRA
jgi:O-antigen/teichoic acid export membrane protein